MAFNKKIPYKWWKTGFYGFNSRLREVTSQIFSILYKDTCYTSKFSVWWLFLFWVPLVTRRSQILGVDTLIRVMVTKLE